MGKWDKRLAAFDYGDDNHGTVTAQKLDATIDALQRELFGNQDPGCPDCYLHSRSILEALQQDLDGYPVTYPPAPCTH